MSKILKAIVATAVFFSAGYIITTAVAADAPAAPEHKLAAGLTPLAQLLQLMDTDKNGKVSKAEFMKYMEAEFDYADKNKDGQLDPAELNSLVRRMSHPPSQVPRPGSVGK